MDIFNALHTHIYIQNEVVKIDHQLKSAQWVCQSFE